MAVVGVDGCPAGWFGVRRETGGYTGFQVFPTIRELWDAWRDASLILIDIPIGLTDSPHQRECDAEARQTLGPRRSSVFTPPCRAALEASSYRQASDINFGETSRKLNQQTWNISAKIREVDQLLRSDAEAQSRIREIHPEVCFWSLNGGQPMQVAKKRSQGRDERLDLLSRFDRLSPKLYDAASERYRRREVARDDILDAMAAAITADCAPDDLLTLPATPRRDRHGLPMEMLYRRPR
jgi:predicted RNase H-like nuclease